MFSKPTQSIKMLLAATIIVIAAAAVGYLYLTHPKAPHQYPLVTAKVIEDVYDASGKLSHFILNFYVQNKVSGDYAAVPAENIIVDLEGNTGIMIYASNSKEGDLPVYVAQVLEDPALLRDPNLPDFIPIIPDLYAPEGDVCFAEGNQAIVACYPDSVIDLTYEENEDTPTIREKIDQAKADLTDDGVLNESSTQQDFMDLIHIPMIHTTFDLRVNSPEKLVFGSK